MAKLGRPPKAVSTGDDGVTLMNATYGRIVLNVGRASIVGANGIGRQITLEPRPKGAAVPVSKDDYAFLSTLDIFKGMLDARIVIVGTKVKEEFRATSDPEAPDDLKQSTSVGGVTEGENVNAIIKTKKAESVTIGAPPA